MRENHWLTAACTSPAGDRAHNPGHVSRLEIKPSPPGLLIDAQPLSNISWVMFWDLGTLLTLRGLPSQGDSISRARKWLTCRHAFQMETNLSRVHILQSLLYQAPTSWVRTALPWSPGARSLTTAPKHQTLIKLGALANPEPVPLAWPIPSYRNHSKVLAHVFCLFPLPPDSRVFSCNIPLSTPWWECPLLWDLLA